MDPDRERWRNIVICKLKEYNHDESRMLHDINESLLRANLQPYKTSVTVMGWCKEGRLPVSGRRWNHKTLSVLEFFDVPNELRSKLKNIFEEKRRKPMSNNTEQLKKDWKNILTGVHEDDKVVAQLSKELKQEKKTIIDNIKRWQKGSFPTGPSLKIDDRAKKIFSIIGVPDAFISDLDEALVAIRKNRAETAAAIRLNNKSLTKTKSKSKPKAKSKDLIHDLASKVQTGLQSDNSEKKAKSAPLTKAEPSTMLFEKVDALLQARENIDGQLATMLPKLEEAIKDKVSIIDTIKGIIGG